MKTRIFVIDDDAEFTDLLKLTLESEGYYRVGAENDSADAIASARAFDPDLILLDVMMPGADGTEVASHMRHDRALAGVPVLFMTALIGDADAPCGSVTSGGHTFLPKSIVSEPSRLIECIEQHLARPAAAAPAAHAGPVRVPVLAG